MNVIAIDTEILHGDFIVDTVASRLLSVGIVYRCDIKLQYT